MNESNMNTAPLVVHRLGNVCTMFSGGTPSIDVPEYYGGTIPFIRSAEINSDKTELFLTDTGMANSSAKLVNVGDLLYALYGATSGEVGIAKISGAINQAILCIRSETENIKFLYYVLQNRKNSILSKYLQGGQGNLSAQIMKALPIVLPPLPEQEKIAGILSCWDEAIEQMQNLIAEKEELRHALATKLLSDNIWADKELSELLNYEQPTNYLVTKVLAFNKGKIPVLTANKSFIIGSTDDDTGIYDKGDCIIFDDFTTDMKYVDFKFKVKSSAIKMLTPKSGVCLKFIFEQMRRIKYPRGGHKRYWLSEFQYLTIRLPDTATQHKIVDILSKADAEIDLLNKKLDILKEQKRGLMQKLLTGEIRVKVHKTD